MKVLMEIISPVVIYVMCILLAVEAYQATNYIMFVVWLVIAPLMLLQSANYVGFWKGVEWIEGKNDDE